MAHWILDLLALGTSCTALYFVVRMRRTYFLDSRFFMAIANTGFVIILLEGLISDVFQVPTVQTLDVAMISLMAISVGFSSYLLGQNSGKSGRGELPRFLLHPPKPFMAYVAIVLIWGSSTIALQPWALHQTLGLDGAVFYYSFEPWFIALGSVLLAAYIAFPVIYFYRQSFLLSDSKATNSTRLISFAWASFGIIALLEAAVASYGFEFVPSIGQLVDSLLFASISYALREPTFLSRIIGAGNFTIETAYSDSEADSIVIYNAESDRRRVVEAFVKQGLADGHHVVCFAARTEIPFYTAVLRGLRKSGNQSQSEPGRVTVQPIEPVEEATDQNGPRPLGFARTKHELIDMGELEPSECRRIIETVRTFDKLPGPRRKARVWALTTEKAHSGLLNMLKESNPNMKIIDLVGHQESFSTLFRTSHQTLLGSKILLEYDPSSDYEGVVQKFAREFASNVEPVAVFTSVGSPVHKRLKKQQDVQLFSFSTKTSTPSKISEQEVLLPERDTSLLLDAVSKLLEAHHGSNVGLAFDVLTDLVILQGFEKAYAVLSSIVEMAQSERATTLVLANYTAFGERALNGIRGLFRQQARYDQNGVKLLRLSTSGSEVQEDRGSQPLNQSEISPRGIIH